MAERRVFDDVGAFDEAFRRLEDWDWLLRYSERYELAFAEEPLADVYVEATEAPPAARPGNPELDGIQRMGTKHLSRIDSWAERMQLRSSLLFEQGAALYRGRRPLAAALYVAAALCIYPMRNIASFRTLRYSAGARLFK